MKILTTYFLAVIISLNIYRSYADTNVNLVKFVPQKLNKTCNENLAGLNSFQTIYNQATMGLCFMFYEQMKKIDQMIPKCSTNEAKIKGLDSTFPTGGIFVYYYKGYNSKFIRSLVNQFLKIEKNAKINIVFPVRKMEKLLNDPILKKVLNDKQVNFIPVKPTVADSRWIQDYIQFTSINNVLSIYHADYSPAVLDEVSIEDTVAYQISQQCNIPYYISTDQSQKLNSEENILDAAGNLEVLPGGTFYRGIVKSPGYNFHVSDKKNVQFPFKTENQIKQEKRLKQHKTKILDLDVSFLEVGHIDEIVSVIKTKSAPPCNFAIMVPSPRKAFRILEKHEKKLRNIESYSDKICKNYSKIPDSESDYAKTDEINKYSEDEKQLYMDFCIHQKSLTSFLSSDGYMKMKTDYYDSKNRKSIKDILKSNRDLILQEVIKTTSCKSSEIFIEIPVLFNKGKSYFPNPINALIHTPIKGASNVITGKTYFKPFDNEIKERLAEHGVDVAQINDMIYSNGGGGVHCGTNSIPLCMP